MSDLIGYVLVLTLFLPGEGGISPLIVYHVTKSVRNRVNYQTKFTSLNLPLFSKILQLVPLYSGPMNHKSLNKNQKFKRTRKAFTLYPIAQWGQSGVASENCICNPKVS